MDTTFKLCAKQTVQRHAGLREKALRWRSIPKTETQDTQVTVSKQFCASRHENYWASFESDWEPTNEAEPANEAEQPNEAESVNEAEPANEAEPVNEAGPVNEAID